ncbi:MULTISPECIES: dolichol kinase [unclassified Halorubrum]|uniref:dolichol kinase n=1 Tax=unclassified Halorubrum TaxID=2642239 RepID=UPI000B980FFA|nr:MULTISPECIES: dolichol kinase [unclassified Halorubrum]OYR41779.1 dolichol kinase [Halorubrum sp. Hd13]OYR49331.1 dolichol kinase [Halorubrum sp. Ea8]OYR50298.1 dolichol kinase [Halorubrum sp. Eb13]OYR52817.1 dolichol kinase [Halorubrum sp. Ea1]
MPLPAAEWRADVEFERRLVHSGGTLYPVPYLLGWFTWTETRYFLLAALAVVLTLEFLRLVVGLDHWLYRKLTREYETDALAGYALYQVSMTGAVLLLEPTLAIPAMWMLSVGDPVSGALGDNEATEAKRPAAWVAMFLVCFGLAVPFTIPAFGPDVGVVVAGAGAAPAAVADGLPPIIRGVAVDDNLTIPPAAAGGMLLALAVVG